MDTSILENIGLTGAEIKVFLALLELGSSSAGPIVEKSGLQNAVVHRALHSLAEKALVTYIFEGKIKHYQTIEPKQLLSFLDEKKHQIEKIIPELEIKRKFAREKPKAVMFQGIRGIKELINMMLETDSKEYYSYGGAQKGDEILGTAFWEGFHKRRVAKKINARIVFHHSLKWWADEINKLKLTEVRTTKKDFEELTETIICGDKVAIWVCIDKPFGFLIEEKLVAESYRKFFEIIWKQAKP